MHNYMGYVYVLVAASCWAMIGPLSRYSLQHEVTPMEVAFWRASIACVFFLLHAFKAGNCRILSLKDGVSIFLFGAVGLAGLFTTLFGVVQLGGAALGAVLLYTALAWVPLFSRIFFGEQLTKNKLVAIACSLLGVICISFSGGGASINVNAYVIGLGLLTGLCYSTHYIVTKLFIQRYTPFVLYGYALLCATLVLLPFVSFAQKSLSDWLVLFTLAFISTYVGYWMYCEGIRRLSPTKAAVLATFEPVLATFLAWWWWGETFTQLGWCGVVLILLAVLLLIGRPISAASQQRNV